MTNQIMGYTVHRVSEFRPNTILFSRENEKITVSMLQEALSHMIEAIIKKNPMIERYSIALKVLRAIQTRLANGQMRKPSKKDLQTACEVLGEIQKEYATTQTKKDNIDAAVSWCKLCIECFKRD